jgi:hypothetical protein
MHDKFTVITPTRDRPELFEICRRWMLRQTIQPLQWLIIDDGDIPLPEGLIQDLDYIRRIPTNDACSIKQNIKEALDYIQYNRVIIVEDDDWYAPDYFKTVLSYLKDYDLAGQGNHIYYHFPAKRWHNNQNKNHASLGMTGFTYKVFDTVRLYCGNTDTFFLDLEIWRAYQGKKTVFFGKPLNIGMKGLPGRKNAGIGKNLAFYSNQDDENYSFLRNHIGDDVEVYKRLYSKKEVTNARRI